MSTGTRGLLLDLDDTLYAYAPAERAGREAVVRVLGEALGCTAAEAESRFTEARAAVHERLHGTGAGHSRRLYLAELVHRAGRFDLVHLVPDWERTYWDAFGSAMTVRAGFPEVLRDWRAAGHRVAITTDLVFDVQLRKLASLGFLAGIDALATSEEAGADKPDPRVLLLGASRLGLPVASCVVVGDSPAKDGGAAHALGIPFIHVDPHAPHLNVLRSALGA